MDKYSLKFFIHEFTQTSVYVWVKLSTTRWHNSFKYRIVQFRVLLVKLIVFADVNYRGSAVLTHTNNYTILIHTARFHPIMTSAGGAHFHEIGVQNYTVSIKRFSLFGLYKFIYLSLYILHETLKILLLINTRARVRLPYVWLSIYR